MELITETGKQEIDTRVIWEWDRDKQIGNADEVIERRTYRCNTETREMANGEGSCTEERAELALI